MNFSIKEKVVVRTILLPLILLFFTLFIKYSYKNNTIEKQDNIVNWLVEHIAKIDTEYKPYMDDIK